MLDERAFIDRVESAGADELMQILARPTADEERALRVYLGDDRYQRMHSLALKPSVRRGPSAPRGNVVVIPGIMGSELTAVSRAGGQDPIWLNILRILAGRLDWLRLGDDGRTEHDPAYDVRATGILKRHYGELLLSLAQHWNVRAFWFDWRKDLNIAAAALEAQLSGWFDSEAPVHLVAHSMGGLVARTFIKQYPERWAAMRQRGSRLIMLGTPNHGSFAIPQVITGLEQTVRKLALLDIHHGVADLLRILNSFVGTYQMLPSPLLLPAMAPLYDARTYGDLNVPQRHLDAARRHHELLRDAVDPERMVYVAGYNQPTFGNVTDVAQLHALAAYEVTLDGDGRVPHALGRLATPDGCEVKTYYVEEDHGNLSANEKVLAALDELLETGGTAGLRDTLPARRGGEEGDARQRLVAAEAADEARLQALAGRLRVRSAEPDAASYVRFDERQVEELLTRGVLSYRGEEVRRQERRRAPFAPTHVELALVQGDIDKVDELPLAGAPVDAIAVGHYLGVKPQAAELALDRAISRALPGNNTRKRARRSGTDDADLLITQYSERGTIRGELGQPFFLTDPRPVPGPEGSATQRTDRVIAIAGMGVPGRFGGPELTVLARELCWSLGRMGRQHLATVLIGAGNGNLDVRDAVSGWIRGVKHAVTGSLEDEQRHLKRITFVESDPRKIRLIQEAIVDERRRLEEQDRLIIEYQPLGDEALDALQDQEREWDLREFRRAWASRRAGRAEATERYPTRITLALDRGTYRFGAITETASIPERVIPLDPALVMRANDELAAEWDLDRQRERGQFLERLLVPEDLRAQFHTDAPLVMLLDATTARIHWEIIAQSELPTALASDRRGGEFLGTSRGFTRQLRTTFAPPPEPPPPPRRILRVLVVADPAEDAHLPGAEAEGVEVADLFESFNRAYEGVSDNRVEVIRLFGPREATRTNVLRHLILHSYDILHFAGHCLYDRQDPAASGWLFTGGERLTANELQRIDRVPKFVLSNACESGITPDRSELRSVDLAPSFAEAFFVRGVSNFVCTAWPVDDVAAREFALTLYAGLLGLEPGPQANRYDCVDPKPMHVAMREARLAIAGTPGGVRTWGAYQHYGSPYLRFFDPTTMQRDRAARKGAAAAAGTGREA